MFLLVEPLVVVHESWYMQGAFQLPARTALRWSLLANLFSFVVWGWLLFFWGVLSCYAEPGTMEGYIAANMAVIGIPVLLLLTIGISWLIEYQVLRRLNRAQITTIPLLKPVLRMNSISTVLAYLLQATVSRIVSQLLL